MIKRFFKILLVAVVIIMFLDTMQNKIAVNGALREATITEVINGNTMKVWLNKEGYEETIQLIGITPKKGAKEYITSQLENNYNGNKIYIEADKNDIGNGRKKLRYVWMEKPKKLNSVMIVEYNMLNAMLIDNGYATPKEEYDNVKYQDDFNMIYEQVD